ncbi:hypothetical protein RYX36_015884 [Vicia faba]
MKENGYNLMADVKFQGWKKYFDRQIGPVFPKLVKQFLIHSTASNHQVTSYVMGKKIATTEDPIGKLIGHEGSEIFAFGQPSNKINDLKDYLRIWYRIILGCTNHRKPTSSPDYINFDQHYMLYFIATKTKFNLPHILFNHLKISVQDTMDEERTKRDWIPLGRLISDILTENKLIEHLSETQQANILEPCAGKPLNAKNLKKMKIIETIKKDPTLTAKEVITIRRVPLKDFPLFTQADFSPEIILRYLED